jgi:nicotinamidase-related amidase
VLVGIETTVRHGADLGYVPDVAEGACSAGDEATIALEVLRFAGDAVFTDAKTVGDLFGR